MRSRAPLVVRAAALVATFVIATLVYLYLYVNHWPAYFIGFLGIFEIVDWRKRG